LGYFSKFLGYFSKFLGYFSKFLGYFSKNNINIYYNIKIKKMYFCEKCNYTTEKLYCWKTHLQSKKHNEEKKEKYCKCCNYNAKTQKLYIQHLQSEKHKKNNEKMENSKIVRGVKRKTMK
jgi:hypothetical protein